MGQGVNCLDLWTLWSSAHVHGAINREKEVGGKIKVERIADNKLVIDLTKGRQTKYKYAYMSYIFGCIQL